MMKRWAAAGAVAVLAVAAMLASAAQAQVAKDYEECKRLVNYGDARDTEAVCTRAMQSALISEKVRGIALMNRGQARRYLGKFEDSITDYTEALALGGPLTFEAWYGRGLSRTALGETGDALIDFERAIEIKPGEAKVYVARGNAYAAQRRFEPAVADYTKAISIDPTNSDAFYARATANKRLGNTEMAMEDYEFAMNLGGESVIVNLQSYLKARGKYKGALDGTYGPSTKKALKACIADPSC